MEITLNLINKSHNFYLKVALNGFIKKTFDVTEFKAVCEPHLAYNIPFCVLLDDNELGRKDATLSVRIIGGENQYVLGITHIYYA